MLYDVLIAGAGASGLLAAALLLREGYTVLVLEKGERVGRKLLSTGNGRCNLGNRDLAPSHFYGDTAFLPTLLSEDKQKQVSRALTDAGLLLRADEAGRLYPATFQAASVVDAFRFILENKNCTVKTGFAVTDAQYRNNVWQVTSADGETVQGKVLLLSMGGCAAPKIGGSRDGYALLRKLGHTVTPPLPALCPLNGEKEKVRALKGLRLKARLTLTAESPCESPSDKGKAPAFEKGRAALSDKGRPIPLQTETGEVLFTEYGLSGICAMQLCYRMQQQLEKKRFCTVWIDLFPELTNEEMLTQLRSHKNLYRNEEAQLLLTGLVPRLLSLHILDRLHIAPHTPVRQLTDAQLIALSALCKGLPFAVTGSQGFAMAQIACGGLDHTQLDAATLGSKKQKNLFVTGELVHIHGDCGGYNLYLCWSTACTAVDAIKQRLQRTIC